MAVRRFVRPVGLAVSGAALIALAAPVSISDGDGGSIGCGTIFAADVSAALDANSASLSAVLVASQGVPHVNYVAGCQSSMSSRRAWSVALATLGLIAVAVGFTT